MWIQSSKLRYEGELNCPGSSRTVKLLNQIFAPTESRCPRHLAISSRQLPASANRRRNTVLRKHSSTKSWMMTAGHWRTWSKLLHVVYFWKSSGSFSVPFGVSVIKGCSWRFPKQVAIASTYVIFWIIRISTWKLLFPLPRSLLALDMVGGVEAVDTPKAPPRADPLSPSVRPALLPRECDDIPSNIIGDLQVLHRFHLRITYTLHSECNHLDRSHGAFSKGFHKSNPSTCQ